MLTQHGQFQVKIEGKTIHVASRGSFNAEGTLKCCEAIDHAIAQLAPSHFLICVDLTEFEGATPDAWDITEQFNQALLSRPLTAKAIIVKSRFVESYVETVNQSEIRHKTQVFSNSQQALTWLNSH